MRRTFSFLYGAFIGSLIGAAFGLLMAPGSGEDVRKQMKDRAEQIQLEVKNAAAARRAEMEKQLETLRAPRP
jgi:gas vesicle protein